MQKRQHCARYGGGRTAMVIANLRIVGSCERALDRGLSMPIVVSGQARREFTPHASRCSNASGGI